MIPSWPTLSRDGRVWRVWVTRERTGDVFLHTEHGVSGGKMTASQRQVTAAGRAKTLLDKAVHDAQKKWTDKQEKEGYRLDEADVADDHADDADTSTGHAGTAGSAGAPTVRCMLAQTANATGVTIAMPCVAQPKIDGFRCLAHVGTQTLASRTNMPFHGFASLKAAIGRLALPATGFGSGQLFLDGELDMEDASGDFNSLSSVLKRGQNQAGFDDPRVVFRVFDCLDPMYPDAPFRERFELVQRLCGAGRLRVVPIYEVRDEGMIGGLLEQFLREGHEGLMLRDPRAPYKQGSRAKQLQKLKKFIDSEFEIVGFSEGAGSDQGTVIWECKTPQTGCVFSVRPMGTHEHRAALLADAASHVGSLLTVKYQELSATDMVPRFPVGKGIRPSFA